METHDQQKTKKDSPFTLGGAPGVSGEDFFCFVTGLYAIHYGNSFCKKEQASWFLKNSLSGQPVARSQSFPSDFLGDFLDRINIQPFCYITNYPLSSRKTVCVTRQKPKPPSEPANLVMPKTSQLPDNPKPGRVWSHQQT